MNKRQSGILLHPTSFPGKYGCGDLGHDAFKVIDWIKKSGFSILQILAIGPTGFGDSPYASFSTFAGTPYIISFDKLIEENLLNKSDLTDYHVKNNTIVDYDFLYKNKFKILKKAFNKFSKTNPEYIEFCNKNNYWLDDYALFMSIKEHNNSLPWNQWKDKYKKKNIKINKLSSNMIETLEFNKFRQWIFFKQWKEFKDYAKENDISIIGDLPIYVLYDSADVWANQELFYLEENGLPKIVAGVPPDYFSETGQLWGNPIYQWDKMKKNNFSWWKKRLRHLLEYVDCIKIDHFRGLESYWEIPYKEKTAINGKWTKTPGYDFFTELKKEFKNLFPEMLIAEDLGVITEEVNQLRDNFSLTGMRIFEFSDMRKNKNDKSEKIFDFLHESYLPEKYINNCIAYPGTHDNDTISGWFSTLSSNYKKIVLDYLKIQNKDKLHESIINKLMNSKADRVVFLMQDLLKLPSNTRMNTPGTCGTHNWSWRIDNNLLTDELAEYYYSINKKSKRL